MSDDNIALFKLALTEGLSNRIDRQISDCTEEIVASPAHSRAMNRIVGCLPKRKLPTSPKLKKIIAILIAAALLLTGCAVAYRNEIRDFFEEIYESFVKINYSDGDDQGAQIEDVYELTYIPEGYYLEKTSEFPLKTTYRYSNANNDTILFEQRVLDTALFFADIENGYTKIVDISIYDVYYKKTKQQTYYMWNDGKFSLVLISKTALSDEELKLIIEGIKTK